MRGGALASMMSFLTSQSGCGRLPTSVVGISTFMAIPFERRPSHSGGDARSRASLVEPDDIVAVDVVEAEIVLRSQALHVVVPRVVDPLPDHWQQGWIVLHEFF